MAARTRVNFEALFDIARVSEAQAWQPDGNGGFALVEIPPDKPAYEWDPVTGEALGVRREPTATNVVYQQDFTVWLKSKCTVEPAGLIRGMNAYLVTWEEDAYPSYLRRGFPLGHLQGKVFSVIAKAGTVSVMSLRLNGSSSYQHTSFNLLTGEVGSVSVSGYGAGNKYLGDGWWLCWVSYPNDSENVYASITSGASELVGQVGSMYLALPQIEDGTRPTSRILVNGSEQTRAADLITPKHVDWYEPAAGTFIIEIKQPVNPEVMTGFGFARITGGTSGKIGIRYTTAGGEVWAGGVKQFDIPYNILAAGFEWLTDIAHLALITYEPEYLDLTNETDGDLTVEPLINHQAGASLTLDYENDAYWSEGGYSRPVAELMPVTRAGVKNVWQPVNGKMMLVEIPADTTAREYDPVTGEPLGISIEPTAVELNSAGVDSSQWIVNNGTLTDTGVESVLQGYTWKRFTATASTNVRTSIQTQPPLFGLDSAKKYTAITLIRKGNTDYIGIAWGGANGAQIIDANTGAIVKQESYGSNPVNNVIKVLDDGTIYYAITTSGFTASGAGQVTPVNNPNATINSSGIISDTYNGTEYVDVVCTSLKQEDAASSVIVNDGQQATVTRPADLPASDPTTFGDWFQGIVGKFIVEWESDQAAYHVFNIGVNTANYLPVYVANGAVYSAVRNNSGGLQQVITNMGEGTQRLEFECGADYIKHRLNGGEIKELQGVTFPDLSSAVATLGVRIDNTNFIGGHIKSFTFIPGGKI